MKRRENCTPIIYPLPLQFEFKYSFTVKYIGFCRQVSSLLNPSTPCSKVVFSDYVGHLHCRLRLGLDSPSQSLHLQHCLDLDLTSLEPTQKVPNERPLVIKTKIIYSTEIWFFLAVHSNVASLLLSWQSIQPSLQQLYPRQLSTLLF